MIYHLYLSAIAVLLCCFILAILKYISISKMRIDNRDSKKKVYMSVVEVLTLLRNVKPFPVGTHKGWKLHSYPHGNRVWSQSISPNTNGVDLTVYGAFCKVRVSAQIVLQILKDVSRTTAWKPGVLATSITSKPQETHDTGSRVKGVMGNTPVQHDIITEESSLITPDDMLTRLLSCIPWVFGQLNAALTLTKEHRRYWHREDNGVCWMLQMNEHEQEWLFFLAQPVEEVDKCALTVLGNIDREVFQNQCAKYVSEILGSLRDYILYRKLQCTPLIDIKLPSARREKPLAHSSSDDSFQNAATSKRMFHRFRSLVERPTFFREESRAAKRELVRSTSILRHKNKEAKGSPRRDRTHSVDTKSQKVEEEEVKERSQSNAADESRETDKAADSQTVKEAKPLPATAMENNNILKDVDSGTVVDAEVASQSSGSLHSHESDGEKDLDTILDEDIHFEEGFEQSSQESQQSGRTSLDSQMSGTKEEVQYIVTANQTAAEILSVALQASNIDLNKSQEDQIINTGGWMFCGLDNDVVILKKISIQESVHCFLGKGIIHAPPKVVWDAIKNPRTRFTYDDSLKKVDLLESVKDNIKIVYYYHEVLQLFKKECCDMVVTQSEKQDGEKYLLAMQSTNRQVVSPAGTLRVKMLPSGWITEPVVRDRKVFTMATYIMQIDFGNTGPGVDKSALEDWIAKQPLSIAYLRQYLSPLWTNKT